MSNKDIEHVTTEKVAVITDLHVEGAERQEASYDASAAFLADVRSRPDGTELLAQWTDADERKVIQKADWVVIPSLFFFALLSASDKVALGTAAILGIKTDLHLVGQDYNWATSMIYFGIIAGVMPQSYLGQRLNIGRVLGTNVFMFGVMCFATAGCKNRAGLFACRFLLGVFEAISQVGYGLVLSMWYKKIEQAWRTSVVYCVMSSLLMGLLGFACQFYHGSLASWRLLYIVMGCISVLAGFLTFVFLPASPHTAWWLSDRQKVIAVLRTAGNKTGIVNRKIKWSQVRENFLDTHTYLLFLLTVLLNIPNGGLSGFYPIIINALGFTTKQTTLLNIPTGFMCQGYAMICAFIAARSKKYCLVAAVSCLVPLSGTIVLHLVPRSNIGGSIAGLYLVYGYWGPAILCGSVFMYANTAGNTKKTFRFSSVYLGYNVGNLVAPQTFRASEAPGYHSAITTMLCCYCLAIFFIGVYWLDCTLRNRRKERDNGGQLDDDPVGDEWKDMTDKENPNFRYVT